MSLRIGIDIGSTTVKVVVLDEQNQLLFRSYERLFSKVREMACEILNSIAPRFSGQDRLRRPGRGQGQRRGLCPGGLRHRRRGE